MTSSTRPKFTPQQAAAIQTPGVSIALSAGAGCGKTFVLTQRFLAGLEPGATSADLHSLVAITFTDRAAREMRDRIRSACHQRLQQCDAGDVEHWLAILRGLDSARISTIHSFCTSLLRSRAVEAGLDPRFGVLEPALADTLLRHTAKETLHGLLENADDDAEAFVLQFGLERSRELLRDLASQRFQIDFEKFENQTPAEIAAQWLMRWRTEFVPKLVAEFRASQPVKRLVELLRENEPNHATMLERRAALLEWLEPTTRWPDPLQALEIIRENARVQGGGSAKSWPSSEIFDVVKDTLTAVRDAAKKLAETLPVDEDDLQLAAEISARALRLARLTAEAYERQKQSQGVLDFDDLLLRARNLLRDHEHVRKRIAAGIRLLMVDEFQDTDPVQADVVRMLCGDVLTRGRLFLVGDAKQSIYRFRRADPGVFARLREEIPAAGRLPLSVNFRSQPAVLDFVNHLFAAGMGENYEPLTPFEPIQHSPTPGIEFLFATFDATLPGGGRESPGTDDITTGRLESLTSQHRGTHAARPDEVRLDDSSDATGRVPAGELREREADWIARRCAELLADPTPRIRERDASGKTILRCVVPGDIVILFRALSNVQDYETALRHYGLDYYLVGGKTFFAQQEVYDLLNLCRYLDDPDDLIGLVGTLRSPFFNLSDDAIQALHRDHLNLHDSLLQEPPAFLSDEQRRRVAFARDVLSDLRANKDRQPIAELLTRAVDRTGYDAALLTEFLGSRKVANLRKLIEMAREFDRAEQFTLKDFVERLQTSVLEETDEEFATTLPETGDVIRLMTIHQAKGLEFPVVIVADIDRKRPPRGRSAVLHPEFGALLKVPDSFGESHDNLGLTMFGLMEKEADADETIRLFYVACTRAADYLILSAGIESDAPRNSPWLELVESRFDLRTGLPKTDPLLGSSSAGTAGRASIPDIRVHQRPPDVKRAPQHGEKLVPLAELRALILAAEPGEIPDLALRVPRDAHDLPPLSVSRLEMIDAKLRGTDHASTEPSRDDELPLDFDRATALGSLVHAALEQFDFAQPESWPSCLERAAKLAKDDVDAEMLATAEQMLTRFLASPIADELASAKSLHREVEFVLRWPAHESSMSGELHPVQIRGVIDVLFEDADGGWHVLDYKTNDLAARATEKQILAPYELQLGVYAHAIEQWLGSPPRELSLVTFRPKVRRVTLSWTNERGIELRQRIDACLDVCRGTVT
jgi:ATP-dependent helicase/nuclease subunit A